MSGICEARVGDPFTPSTHLNFPVMKKYRRTRSIMVETISTR
jgi:hypothetical protein